MSLRERGGEDGLVRYGGDRSTVRCTKDFGELAVSRNPVRFGLKPVADPHAKCVLCGDMGADWNTPANAAAHLACVQKSMRKMVRANGRMGRVDGKPVEILNW